MVGQYIPVRHESSITPVKTMARLGGWNGGKTEKDRKFLSDLKDLLTAYNDTPLKHVIEVTEAFKKGLSGGALFIDVREPAEIKKAVAAIGAKTVLVTNKNVPVISTNHADANVANYEYDYVVVNDGDLDDLYDKALEFCQHFGLVDD